MASLTAQELARPKGIDWGTVRAKLGPLIGLVFVVALFGVLRPATFLAPANFQVILMRTAVVATAALELSRGGHQILLADGRVHNAGFAWPWSAVAQAR